MDIPITSPTAYPEPAVLLVNVIDDTSPDALVSIVAVASVPLPVIAYNETFVTALIPERFGLYPVPAFVILNVFIGPPTFSINP